jgi:hypothetical protein
MFPRAYDQSLDIVSELTLPLSFTIVTVPHIVSIMAFKK